MNEKRNGHENTWFGRISPLKIQNKLDSDWDIH